MTGTARRDSAHRDSVHRDSWGIPRLWADDVDGLARLQGRVTALDRAWQLETERWRGEGTLAAHLGVEHLPWDRFARRVRLADTARRCFARLAPATRRWVGAFVTGVNEGLAAARAPEFAACGRTPGRWQPWSPLLVFLVQHILFGTFGNKLWRAHVTATLGAEAVALFDSEGPGGSGSNCWVVPGGPGGAPVIAGDPHRLIEFPGVYHQIQLACPEFDVIGLSFPGVPGIPHFGHAGEVAWAVTNAMADYQDLYREQLRRGPEGMSVREPDGWAPVDLHTEQIGVRDGEPVEVEVIETGRGPVIDVDPRTGEAISLRTPCRVESALGFDALLPLLRARSVDDVTAALGRWVEPVNSVLVADRSGRIRRLVAGLVPIRPDRCRRVPVPGWEAGYRWQGYATLPAADEAGPVVNANDRRPGDTAQWGVDFAPPHRADRIRALLTGAAARESIAPESVTPETVHSDTRLVAPELDRLLTALDAELDHRLDPRVEPAAVRRLRDRLLGWDRRMTVDSGTAGAYAAWRAALVRRLAADPALLPLWEGPQFDPVFAPWTDPTARIGYALAAAVTGLPRHGADVCAAAVAALTDVVAADSPAATWGERHRLHPLRVAPAPAAADPAADLLARLRVPLAGDTDCVLATASVPGVSDACWRGPVARYVWDLADRAASRWVVPFGAAGDPADPHAADQLPHWLAGALLPVVTDRRG